MSLIPLAPFFTADFLALFFALLFPLPIVPSPPGNLRFAGANLTAGGCELFCESV